MITMPLSQFSTWGLSTDDDDDEAGDQTSFVFSPTSSSQGTILGITICTKYTPHPIAAGAVHFDRNCIVIVQKRHKLPCIKLQFYVPGVHFTIYHHSTAQYTKQNVYTKNNSPNPGISLRKLPRPNLPLALTSNLLVARGALIRSKCPVNGGVQRASKRLSSALYNPKCTMLASFTLAVTLP